MIRVAVIWESFGPYHVARAKALAEQPGLEAIFVELASKHSQHHWETQRDPISDYLITLVDGPYKKLSRRELSSRLVEKLTALDPDAVVVSGYYTGPLRAAARWARAKGRASILMFVGTPWDSRRRWWKEPVKRWFIRRHFDSTLVGGKSHRQYLASLGVPAEHIWEKGNVVDNSYFADRAHAARQRTNQELPSQASFLFVGRLSSEKNLFRLLEAYREYRRAGPGGWGLVMVGDGPQYQELRHRAVSLGLDDVRWLGYRQIDELPSIYAQSDALILPSVSETWGLVVNEAMACGLPVLVSNRCGCAMDLVEDGKNGYSFDPEVVSEIAIRMTKLASLSNAKRDEMGHRSRTIIAAYTPEAWAKNVADCIGQTIARRSRGDAATTA